VERRRLVAVAVLAGAALGAPPRAWAADRAGWEAASTPVKPFTLQDLQGRSLRASDLQGKVVVVDFWATWCAPCIKELPDLLAYQERLRGRKDVAFLSLNVTEEKDVVAKFVADKKIAFPVYLADALLEPWEVAGFPTKLVLDLRKGATKPGQAGLIRFRREGTAEVATIEARVAEVLATAP
jgi:thiol-disulfide isomerase/thioredoxin